MAKTPYDDNGRTPYSGDPVPSGLKPVPHVWDGLKRAVSPKGCPECGSKNVRRRMFEPREEPSVGLEMLGCVLEAVLWPFILILNCSGLILGGLFLIQWRKCLCLDCGHEWKSWL